MTKITVPEDVVDKKSYLKFYALSNNPILKDKLYLTSEGREVNIGWLPHRLREEIQSLPPSEQELILERKGRYMKLLQQKNLAKAMAYGNKGLGHNSDKSKKTLQDKAEEALEEDIVTLLGRMFSINEVVRIIVEDNGVAITKNKVQDVMRRNLVTIERAREEFRNKVTDVRLYNKRPRLEELAWMYSKMKMRYIAMNSTESYNAMLRTLEQIRKEAEGDILNINGKVDVNLSVELQAHIQKEIIKTINLKEIILGRVAARMNYDTSKLIAGLHNSYYNRFVQISGDYDPGAEMQYPSLVNYDFGEIERRNAEVDDIVEMEPEHVKEEEHDKAQDIKNLFLAKIRRQKEEYEQRTSTAVVEEESMEREAKEDYEEYERDGHQMRYDRQARKEKRKPYNLTPEGRERVRAAIKKTNEKLGRTGKSKKQD